MSMISEQVQALRDVAQAYQHNGLFLILNNAANTIESLSAKLAAENMDRSDRYCGGGWIACEDRLPEESGYYDVTIESKINDETVRTTECRCFHKDIEFWAELIEPEFSIDETIIAWRNRPEPYRP